MISSATSVSMNDHIMTEGRCKIERNLCTNGPVHPGILGDSPGSNAHPQEALHPKRKAIDSSLDAALSSCSSSGEDEDGNDHGASKDQPRAFSISPKTERRLLSHLSEAIRRHKDHGACMLALASRISESTIHPRDFNVAPAKNTEEMIPMLLPNKRARYQRRNSFVIHRNPEHHGLPPPSLLQGQDLEEAMMHQSVPEFYRPDSGPIHQTGPQNLLSALHLHHQQNVWGNASWSNSNDTERYAFSSVSTQNKRIFPMPTTMLLPPQRGLSGIAVGDKDLFPCPLPKSQVAEYGCGSSPTPDSAGL
jgi:hypothetical protein